MDNKKSPSKIVWKVLVFVLFCCVLWIFGSYKTASLHEKALVLGMGIDYDKETKLFSVVAEVVIPASVQQQTSGAKGSQLIVGEGETVPEALQKMYKKSGRNPALGQTNIVLLGEGTFGLDLRSILAYFVLSDAFKDGTTVACTVGKAQTIFESTTPLDTLVSFALQGIIKQAGEKITVPSNILQAFVEKQLTKSASSFLTCVEFVPSLAPEKGEDKALGLFDCSKINVFREGVFVKTLSEKETKGFLLMQKRYSFEMFVEDGENFMKSSSKNSVEIISKKVSMDFVFENNQPKVKFGCTMNLRNARTDSNGEVLDLLPRTKSKLANGVAEAVEKNVGQNILEAANGFALSTCDVFHLANNFYARFGKRWEAYQNENPDYLKKIEYTVDVKVVS